MIDPKVKAVDKFYQDASDHALAYVEQEARKILAKHPNLDEFIMCMGSYFFTRKKGKMFGDDAIVGTPPKYIDESPLVKFIEEWDPYLKLTGAPMRFTATGPVVTDWGKR